MKPDEHSPPLLCCLWAFPFVRYSTKYDPYTARAIENRHEYILKNISS